MRKVSFNSLDKEFGPMLYQEHVETVYVGRRGCMCGCRGSYAYSENPEHEWQGSANPRLVARRLNLFRKRAQEVDCIEVNEDRSIGNGVILAVEVDDKVVVVYLKS